MHAIAAAYPQSTLDGTPTAVASAILHHKTYVAGQEELGCVCSKLTNSEPFLPFIKRVKSEIIFFQVGSHHSQVCGSSCTHNKSWHRDLFLYIFLKVVKKKSNCAFLIP